MATVSTFRLCTYASEADLAAIASLINCCRAADDLDVRTSVAELREDFASPRFDLARDLRLWRDGAGDLVVIAEFWHTPAEPDAAEVLGSLYFNIHPQVRGQGLAAAALAWGEQRLRQMERGRPLVLHTGCRDRLTGRRALLGQLGFVPERYFFELKRSLQEPIVVPPLPTDWTIRAVDAERDAVAWVDMFNQSFVDHWNHSPMTLEDYHYYTGLSEYEPALDLVIETAAGDLVTFCYCKIDRDRNQRLDRREGHVCLLGTRRGYRRQGLARTLLAAGLNQLKSMGMETATIGVDGQNPNGAVALYRSVGFTEDFRSTVYRKEVAPEAWASK